MTNFINALMPGEHDWMSRQPMPGQRPNPGAMINRAEQLRPKHQQGVNALAGVQQAGPQAQPQKRGFGGMMMNALGTVLKYGAPEAYEQGRQRRYRELAAQALEGGDYETAAKRAFQYGNIEDGTAYRQAGIEQRTAAETKARADQERAKATRVAEAKSTLAYFSQIKQAGIDPMQIIMSDPEAFETATGMSVQEFAGFAQKLPPGTDTGQLVDMIIAKSRAEAGEMPQAPDISWQGDQAFAAYKDPLNPRIQSLGRRDPTFEETSTENDKSADNVRADQQLALDTKIANQESALGWANLKAKENETNAGPAFKDVAGVRREFNSITANYRDIEDSYQRIETMATQKTSSGDLALIVSFTKLLDPGSVAREGEVQLTQSAASLRQRAENLIPQLMEGKTILPPELRSAYVSAAREMKAAYDKSYVRLQNDYGALADRYKIDRRDIMVGVPGRDEGDATEEEDYPGGVYPY